MKDVLAALILILVATRPSFGQATPDKLKAEDTAKPAAPDGQQDEIKNTLKDLRRQIKTMAEILKSDDLQAITDFLMKYADLTSLEEAKEFTPDEWKSLAKGFMENGKKDLLRKILLHVLDKTPQVEEDGATYTYTFNKKEIDDELPRNTFAVIYSEDSGRFLIKN